MSSYPKISIVTPSSNQGPFIEETIVSVLGAGYPHLEYIIIDGGSTDETVEIVQRYEDRLAFWISEADDGQAHAINKGFDRATGDILGWLNSDDMYLPRTLTTVREMMADPGRAEILFGNCVHFTEVPGEVRASGSEVKRKFQTSQLSTFDYIIQPSSFWTKKAWETVGPLREDLHFAFDWEWYLRAERSGVMFHPVDRALSMYRFHPSHKTGNGGERRQRELLSIYREYNPRIANLYEILIADARLDLSTTKVRAAGKLLRTLGWSADESDILKLLQGSKYKKYTSREIFECLAML